MRWLIVNFKEYAIEENGKMNQRPSKFLPVDKTNQKTASPLLNMFLLHHIVL